MTSAAEHIISLYQRHAADWDQERGRSLVEKPWLDRFLALLPPGASVLDLGCGAGEPIARYLIAQGCAVTGVDAAPALLRLCKHRFPDQEWVVADMRTLCLRRRFDGIVAWDSFFHLPPAAQRRMFSLFQQHAAPKAALLFTSGPAHGETTGVYKDEPLYHASLDGEEYRSLLDRHGFDVVAHILEDPACGGHTVWLAQLRQGCSIDLDS